VSVSISFDVPAPPVELSVPSELSLSSPHAAAMSISRVLAAVPCSRVRRLSVTWRVMGTPRGVLVTARHSACVYSD
jgi:hypothetical protein